LARNSLSRQFRYLYLRLIRLRGHPHELSLGMAFGIFMGMTPTIPFHTIVAVALALVFKASKITAVAGTLICNPITIYPIYKYCYSIGAFILGFYNNKQILASIMDAINHGELLHMVTNILGAGGMVVAAFLLGGIVLGIIFAVPSYFIFFYFFKIFISWHKSRKLTEA
jgi:uncharacterized protein (DUF2062 family)